MSEEGRKKGYFCCFCNQQCQTPSLLAIHERIHTGEKPYECSFCNKCFTRRYHLSVHQRTHTGEKPYKCEQCSKCFTTIGNLRSHQVTHNKKLFDELTTKNAWLYMWKFWISKAKTCDLHERRQIDVGKMKKNDWLHTWKFSGYWNPEIVISGHLSYGPRHEKTCLRGFRQSQTKISLHSYSD